jgi:hypothetical protein
MPLDCGVCAKAVVAVLDRVLPRPKNRISRNLQAHQQVNISITSTAIEPTTWFTATRRKHA